MNYRIENGLIIITLKGLYPVGGMLELMRSALDDPEARKPARILVDASLSKTIRNTTEIEEVARVASGWKEEIERIGCYVNSDLHHGLMRMATAFSDFSSFDVAPFRSYEEALAFLKKP